MGYGTEERAEASVPSLGAGRGALGQAVRPWLALPSLTSHRLSCLYRAAQCVSLSLLIVFACRVAETRSISRYDASRRVFQFISRKKCLRRVSMTLLSHWYIDICVYQRHITQQKITYIWFPSPLSKTAADHLITAPARTCLATHGI